MEKATEFFQALKYLQTAQTHPHVAPPSNVFSRPPISPSQVCYRGRMRAGGGFFYASQACGAGENENDSGSEHECTVSQQCQCHSPIAFPSYPSSFCLLSFAQHNVQGQKHTGGL